MQSLTSSAREAVADLARRHGVSEGAVQTLLAAVAAGQGSMAQFHHADLGGGGQWLRGGMTMVGDMFNTGLKAKVNALCTELSSLVARGDVFEPPAGATSPHGAPASGGSGSGAWWPAGLAGPSASGGQNDFQYAYFAGPSRLAVKQSGRITVYDTLDHRIGGVQQQQQGSAAGSFSFTSQHGTFAVDSLPVAPTTTTT
jgi:hypothetical protein